MRKIGLCLLWAVFLFVFPCSTAEAEDGEIPEKMRFEFMSGAGGWSTEITLKGNGRFIGTYHDSELGSTGSGYENGTIYYCNFSGKFKKPKKVSAQKYRLTFERLKIEDGTEKERVRDGVRYVASEPYGIERGKKYILCCPGYPISSIPEKGQEWLRMAAWVSPSGMVLEKHVLYNKKMGYAFYEE